MKIAIRGHVSRGIEVIQILESLGGKNNALFTGSEEHWYFINPNGYIRKDYKSVLQYKGFKTYTLEEFEKEFPFKIGDRVISLITGLIGTITTFSENKIYHFKYDTGIYSFTIAEHLKLYKEMKEERNITLTLSKAKEWYKKGGELREVALQAYSEEELTKVELPRTWEEFCEKYPIQDHEAFINFTNSSIIICKECAGSGLGIWMRKPEKDRCKCVSQKSAEAHLAMIQLEQLRNCWWNGWEPIWDVSQKYCIYLSSNEIQVRICTNVPRFLTFPTREIAEEFLKCFRSLIEKAKDLI